MEHLIFMPFTMNNSTHPYPKILAVTPLENYQLRVTFSNHVTKVYDCTEVLMHPAFSLLHDTAIFRAVHVAQCGYGVVWTDDIDLSESEQWIHGRTIPLTPLTMMEELQEWSISKNNYMD